MRLVINSVCANNLIQCYVFKNPNNSDVISGEDGWLFYNIKYDGNPVGSYMGENLFTEEQLEQIAENMTITRDNLALEDVNLYFLLHLIRSEYTQNIYHKDTESRQNNMLHYR